MKKSPPKWNWEKIEVTDFDLNSVDKKDITGIYFSEKTILINDDGSEKTLNEEKCSPIYHIGVRLSVNETIELLKNDPKSLNYFQNIIALNPDLSVCKTDFGYLEFISPGDMTLEEYEEIKNNTK